MSETTQEERDRLRDRMGVAVLRLLNDAARLAELEQGVLELDEWLLSVMDVDWSLYSAQGQELHKRLRALLNPSAIREAGEEDA